MAKKTIIPYFLHGGDYNPEQWRDKPDILDEDMRLLKEAHCNSLTVGMFVWTSMETDDGVYDFSYMDHLMKTFEENGVQAILGTPSGAIPAWLAQKYPEVLRVDRGGRKNRYGSRHNHCYTSPVYRRKVREINTRLAERYKDSKALFMWHLSNEYGGECYCEACAAAFREWLKEKYRGDLQALNFHWSTMIWDHVYTDWEQIEPPFDHGHGFELPELILDWKRFVTHQTVDFMNDEAEPLRRITPNIPITTNLMGFYNGLDYRAMAKHLDIVSWDNYPTWHAPQGDIEVAVYAGMAHDLMRSLKKQSFMLMESTPSLVNWAGVNRLKAPGMHELSSLQAVAHGSDTVQYFQWRQCRGGIEKFHGAVVSHAGHANTRTFRDVSALGKRLEGLTELVGTETVSTAAMLYDWDCRWAFESSQGFNNRAKDIPGVMQDFYRVLWKHGIDTDIIGREQDFSPYRLLVLPEYFLADKALIDKLCAFVRGGGVVVASYLSGMVDEYNMTHTGGFPAGALKEVFGLWNEEADSLYESQSNRAVFPDGTENRVCEICEIVHPTTAQVLAVYGDGFYQGEPVLLSNAYGKGKAYYVASRGRELFENAMERAIADAGIANPYGAALPEGVTLHTRRDQSTVYVFLQNFTTETKTVDIGKRHPSVSVPEGTEVGQAVSLAGYETKILKFEQH